MSLAHRMAVALGFIGLFHSCIAAYAQSGPTGTFALRVPSVEPPTEAAQAGKGLATGDRYWWYIDFKILAAVVPTSERELSWTRVELRPVDVPLPPGNISVYLVTYRHLDGFCGIRWDTVANIPIEVGSTTTLEIDWVGERWAKAVLITGNGERNTIMVSRDCVSDPSFGPGDVSFFGPASQNMLAKMQNDFRERTNNYNDNKLVLWARETLRSPLSSRYVKLGKYANAVLGSYEVDGFQLRQLIKQLETSYHFADFNVLDRSDYFASEPADLREKYQKFLNYVTNVRSNMNREIRAFYSIAEKLEEAPNPPRQRSD